MSQTQELVQLSFADVRDEGIRTHKRKTTSTMAPELGNKTEKVSAKLRVNDGVNDRHWKKARKKGKQPDATGRREEKEKWLEGIASLSLIIRARMNPAPSEAVRDNQTQPAPPAPTLVHTHTHNFTNTHNQTLISTYIYSMKLPALWSHWLNLSHNLYPQLHMYINTFLLCPLTPHFEANLTHAH